MLQGSIRRSRFVTRGTTVVAAELMDLSAVCRSFPELPDPQILRDNVLDAIEDVLRGTTQIVVVEGVEGIGKTTLLAQFVQRQPRRAFSVFIRPTSRWAYDPAILRFDLCNQLEWVLHGRELDSTQEADDSFLRSSWLELQRRARREVYFFLVDGLTDIPPEDRQLRGQILDMLPIGLPRFRFLISTAVDQAPLALPGGATTRACYELRGK